MIRKQEDSDEYTPRIVSELINLCSQNQEECEMHPRLKSLSLESLVTVFERGTARIDQLVAYLSNRDAPGKSESDRVDTKDEFLERVFFEEEYGKMKARAKDKKKENRVLKEKIMIINLRAKELAKEKLQLQRDLDQKIYEKYEILKTIKKDYEQTKIENIRYLDRIDELERQKEVIQDGYHMFSEENERLRKEIRKLYSDKIDWFRERDQILSKLGRLDVSKLRRSQHILQIASRADANLRLEQLCQTVQDSMQRLETHSRNRPIRRAGGAELVEKSNEENVEMGELRSQRMQEREGRLKALKREPVVKGLRVKNKLLRKENQKYFEFILELKSYLKLENNGIADRIMTLVEKNVDNLFLHKKIASLRENSNLLENQNKQYQLEMGKKLRGIHSEVQGLKTLKRSLLARVEVVCRENQLLKKCTESLGSINFNLSKELSRTSQLLRGLVQGAQQEVARTGQILSKQFWENLNEVWDNNVEASLDRKELFPKSQSREDQEYLLDLLDQSSAEAHEEQLHRAKGNLDEVVRFLEGGGQTEHGPDGVDGDLWQTERVQEQLTSNAQRILEGMWQMWRSTEHEKRVLQSKLECVTRKSDVLKKRDSLAN